MIGDEIRTAISLLALFSSALSLYLTRRLWLSTNRPIVVAFVDECSSGNTSTAFNVVISNVGNRPALEVRLHADKRSLDALVSKSAPDEVARIIASCFDGESAVSVLRNGEELVNAFGSYSSDVRWQHLNYGAVIPIRLTYSDLSGRVYSEGLRLKVFARNGFAGSVWKVRGGSK